MLESERANQTEMPYVALADVFSGNCPVLDAMVSKDTTLQYLQENIAKERNVFQILVQCKNENCLRICFCTDSETE
jgi:hypothetical protein